ncbi:hypothetical protein ACHAXR_000539, partial [Thalassiosira sp. AJA248-18]
SGGGHNPVFLAKVIFRKVVDLLVTSDEENLTGPALIIVFLRDIILGVILGVITISIVIFLDHRDIAHFQSVHNFRDAAFQMLNDPETIATLEESSDMKFLTVDDFEAKRREIDAIPEKLKKNDEVLDKKTEEVAAKKAELDAMKPEYEKMLHNPLLGLDKYCGTCIWGNKFTCDGRVKFLQDTYNTKPIQGKLSAMGQPSCISK